ncbi:MAG: hypothetical protein IJS31_06400 [Oscillospiraceae bacterium]|nr:hypothetical protein [Oscillospiraceae bacterium]
MENLFFSAAWDRLSGKVHFSFSIGNCQLISPLCRLRRHLPRRGRYLRRNFNSQLLSTSSVAFGDSFPSMGSFFRRHEGMPPYGVVGGSVHIDSGEWKIRLLLHGIGFRVRFIFHFPLATVN